MRDKTCCFTGHRNIPPGQAPLLLRALRKELTTLIKQGYRYFGAGGALGFDTLAAQAVLQLKSDYPQIKLILVLPCLSQADQWEDADKSVYEAIKRQADKVVYTSKEYTRDCMHKRNRHLIDHSSLCIAYLTAASGGTAYTVSYAKKQNIPVINLALRINL